MVHVAKTDYLAEIFAVDGARRNDGTARTIKGARRLQSSADAAIGRRGTVVRAVGQGTSTGHLYLRDLPSRSSIEVRPQLYVVINEHPAGTLLRSLLVACAVVAALAWTTAHPPKPIADTATLDDVVGFTVVATSLIVSLAVYAIRGGFQGRVISSFAIMSVLSSMTIVMLEGIFLLVGHADKSSAVLGALPGIASHLRPDRLLFAAACIQVILLLAVLPIRLRRLSEARSRGRNVDSEWIQRV